MPSFSQQVFIYADASYSKRAQLAVLGFLIFKSHKEHEELTATHQSPFLFEMPESNNIRAELRGVLWALQSCLPDIKDSQTILYTDCQAISGLLNRRAHLEATQFISQSTKKPLSNMDLYKEFYKIYDLLQPQVIWVRGHTSQSSASKVESNFAVLDKAVRKRLRQKVALHENKNLH